MNIEQHILVNCYSGNTKLLDMSLREKCTIKEMKNYIAKETNEYPHNIRVFIRDKKEKKRSETEKDTELLTSVPFGSLPISSIIEKEDKKDKDNKLNISITVEKGRLKRI